MHRSAKASLASVTVFSLLFFSHSASANRSTYQVVGAQRSGDGAVVDVSFNNPGGIGDPNITAYVNGQAVQLGTVSMPGSGQTQVHVPNVPPGAQITLVGQWSNGHTWGGGGGKDAGTATVQSGLAAYASQLGAAAAARPRQRTSRHRSGAVRVRAQSRLSWASAGRRTAARRYRRR